MGLSFLTLAHHLWPQFSVGGILREAFVSPSLPNARIESPRLRHLQKGSWTSSKMVRRSFQEMALHCWLNCFNLMYLREMHMLLCIYECQRTPSSPSTFMWVLGLELGLLSLCGQHLYQLNHSHCLYCFITQLSGLLRHFITQALLNRWFDF